MENFTNLKENPFPYKDTCSTRERVGVGNFVWTFYKLMSVMVLIKLIVTKLGWKSMFNN